MCMNISNLRYVLQEKVKVRRQWRISTDISMWEVQIGYLCSYDLQDTEEDIQCLHMSIWEDEVVELKAGRK